MLVHVQGVQQIEAGCHASCTAAGGLWWAIHTAKVAINACDVIMNCLINDSCYLRCPVRTAAPTCVPFLMHDSSLLLEMMSTAKAGLYNTK